MKNFSHIHGEQNPLSGYVSAFTLFMSALFLTLNNQYDFVTIRITKSELLLAIVLLTFCMMLVAEYFGRRSYQKKGYIQVHKAEKPPSNIFLLKSTLYRFLALFSVFYFLYFILNNHSYFSQSKFDLSREYFSYLLYIYLSFGPAYIFFTLKYKWSKKYEFNDYGILLIIFFKSAFHLLLQAAFGKKQHLPYLLRLRNKRIKKVLLVHIVNFFFLTLMVHFFESQFSGFSNAVQHVLSPEYSNLTFFKQYHAVYLVLFHLLFIVDVGIAIIGYTVANRWLDNRTKSVDMTISGWFFALICYPPMNTGLSDYFINFNQENTHNIITNEPTLMLLMALILACFTVYVWATVVLGFKFSNLTNRGIVTTGPYSYVRHPAYSTKNLAWWLDNTHALSNSLAIVGMLIWNLIYVFRALTEERHLKHDAKYRQYFKKVRYRFIPGWF